MKFWFTVVIGVIAVAAGATAMIVMTPTVPIEPASTAAKDVVFDPDKAAAAEIVGDLEVDHGRVGQRQKGQDVFRVRNSGKADLIVTPMKATCQCTDVYLSDREPSPSEKAPDLHQQRSDFVVKPGQLVYVVARWDTKEKLGKQNVGVPVALTNDPRKTQIQFRINLDIHKEFIQSPERFEFGMISEGEKRKLTATITSLVRDKFAFERLEVGPKGFTVKAVPMNDAELKEAGAKSGYNVVVETTGDLPAGGFDAAVAGIVKTADSAETVSFPIKGRVLGDMETSLKDDVIDFKDVSEETYPTGEVKQIVTIFARNLKDSETLKLGTVKPSETFTAKLEKHPKISKGWTLTVQVKPGAPGGLVRDGQISIVDSTGRERLVFRATALIDPAFKRTASR